jgi:hypothetical protein
MLSQNDVRRHSCTAAAAASSRCQAGCSDFREGWLRRNGLDRVIAVAALSNAFEDRPVLGLLFQMLFGSVWASDGANTEWLR